MSDEQDDPPTAAAPAAPGRRTSPNPVYRGEPTNACVTVAQHIQACAGCRGALDAVVRNTIADLLAAHGQTH